MARTTRGDWISTGLALLRDRGESALTIDAVAAALDRTKGSFYHHFDDVDGFHDALLEAWRQTSTEALIARVDEEPDPRRRRVLLARLAAAIDARLELAIRAWGLRDARARAAIAAVDAARIVYLERLWIGIGRRRGARTLARVEYAAYLGAMQLWPDLSARPAREAERLLERALTGYRTRSG